MILDGRGLLVSTHLQVSPDFSEYQEQPLEMISAVVQAAFVPQGIPEANRGLDIDIV